MVGPDCPRDAELLAWLQDPLDVERHQLLTAHLDACAACQTRLEQLEAEQHRMALTTADDLQKDLRRPPPVDDLESEPECATAALRAAAAIAPAAVAADVSRQPSAADVEALTQRGHYEILDVLGRGGMGIVYKARHIKSNRVVALKMILTSKHASMQERIRFQIEAEAVAHLQHPNIVQLHDVGEHDGVPFFSLEFCDGGALDGKLKTWTPAAAEAAALVETLARAMHHAHLRGVVHRDLKPANVLFSLKSEIRNSKSETNPNTQPRNPKPGSAGLGIASSDFGIVSDFGFRISDFDPKITDFGLAKKLDSGNDLSHTGAIMGTPSYMAPEQATGRVHDISPATDVYALGAILYVCLTGRVPFKGSSLHETLKQVLEREPESLRRLKADVPLDLDTICLKCLEKDSSKRYASGAELAEDLGRYRRGEPVSARPVGRLERGWRWCRRNPAVASLLALVLLVLAVGTTVSMLFAFAAAQQAATAKREQGTAEDNAKTAKEKADEADRERDKANKEAKAAREAERLARRRSYDAAMLLTQAAWEQHRVERFLQLLAEDEGQTGADDFRGFEWYYWKHQIQRGHFTLKGHTAEVLSVAFSPDGQRLASGSADGRVLVWDVLTGKVATLKAHTSAVHSVCFSPDGTRLASGSTDGTVKLWDVQTGRKILSSNPMPSVWSVAFSPDGQRLALGTGEVIGKPNEVKVWDLQRGQETISFKGHLAPVLSVAFSPDGQRIASRSFDMTVKVWDVESGQETFSLPGHTYIHWSGRPFVASVAFSPDGKRLASSAAVKDDDNAVKVWDLEQKKEILSLKGHTEWVRCVCFSPDGKRLASAAGENGKHLNSVTEQATRKPGEVKVWDLETGREIFSLKGHLARVNSVCFSRDGKRLASGSLDQTVKVWDAENGQEPATIRGHEGAISRAVFSGDGKLIATSGVDDKTVRVWDAQTGEQVALFKGHKGAVSCVAFSPDAKRLAAAVGEVEGKPGSAEVKVWDREKREAIFSLTGHTKHINGVCFSPDGQHIASAGWDNTVRVWNAQTGAETLVLRGNADEFTSVCFSPDGQQIAAGSNARTVKVWDLQTGKEIHCFTGHDDFVSSVCFSPDGERLITGSLDQTVKVWDLQKGREPATFKGHTGTVFSVAVSPDGKRIVSGSGDRTVKVWGPETGQELLSLKGHLSNVSSVCFSPDGKRIASGSHDGTVKVWDATTDQ